MRQRHSPHKRPLGAERKRKTPPREKFADKSGRRGAQTVRGCSSVGTRHCYINKRGSSRHRGFIGFQFAPNRTLPFLCHPSPSPSPFNLPAARRAFVSSTFSQPPPLRYSRPSTGTSTDIELNELPFFPSFTEKARETCFALLLSLNKISRSGVI